jgi:hypothetical protein
VTVGTEDLQAFGFRGGRSVRFCAGIGIAFIGQIVGYTSKGIDGMDMGSEFFWN